MRSALRQLIVSHGQLLRVGREPDAQEATNRHCRLHAVGSPRRMWWRFPDRVFAHWDKLAEDHGVEKIKTIGDADMVVAGIPLHRIGVRAWFEPSR